MAYICSSYSENNNINTFDRCMSDMLVQDLKAYVLLVLGLILIFSP